MKQPDRETAVEAAIVTIAVGFLTTLIASWYMMLLIGVVHAELLTLVKPVGYGTAIIVTVLLFGAGVMIFRIGHDK